MYIRNVSWLRFTMSVQYVTMIRLKWQDSIYIENESRTSPEASTTKKNICIRIYIFISLV